MGKDSAKKATVKVGNAEIIEAIRKKFADLDEAECRKSLAGAFPEAVDVGDYLAKIPDEVIEYCFVILKIQDWEAIAKETDATERVELEKRTKDLIRKIFATVSDNPMSMK